jgi:hypothetical protein
VNAQDTPESYEAYLEAVRKQEQRDRDRFTGQDSHDDQPLYDARTGAEEWLITPDADGVRPILGGHTVTIQIPVSQQMLDDADDVDALRGYIARALEAEHRRLMASFGIPAAMLEDIKALPGFVAHASIDDELLYGNSFHIASNGQMQRLEPLGIFNGASPLRTWHAWKDEPKEPKAEPTERTRHTYPKPKREWWRR